MKMDFTFFYRTFVILCLDITISAPLKTEDCTPKKKARTQNEDQNTELWLRRICLQEMGEQPNVSIPKLGAFKLGELLKCMDTKYAQLQAACGEDDPKFDAVTYCNLYRKEVERFEALFKRLIADSPSLNTTLYAMVPLFQEEREAARGQIRMDFNGDLGRRTLFEKCSRVEKWRIILTWFSLFLSDGGTCMLSAAVEEQLLEKWRDSLEHLKPKVEKDFETFINGGVRYRAIENLPLQFKEEFKVLSEFQSTDCSRFNEEIKAIGHGFHDGFQRCSAQVKKIEELKTPPDQLFIVRARISGLLPHLENSDDSVIHRCLSLMVEVGDNSRRI